MLNSKFDLYKTEWLDLVFADRNKTYGAYDLRIHYGDNMLKALAITMVGFTLAAGAFTYAFKHDVVDADTRTIINIAPPPIIAPSKIEKPVEAIKKTQPAKVDAVKPATTTPQVNIKTQAFPIPKISNHAEAIDMPKLDPNVAIASTNNEGDATKPATGILDGTNIAGPPGAKPGVAGGDDNSPHDLGGLDVMPEPVGGNAAWAKFLQKNLRYPDTEVQGRVIISFIIEKDGHLTDLKVIKGVITDLDREAMRVLKLAPAWKPGLQNGKPVRVKYTIPIVFQISE